MVSQNEQQRARRYICERLEESGTYSLETTESFIEATEKPDRREVPRAYAIILPNLLDTIGSFQQLYQQCFLNDVYVVPVFYKDGKTAFVRMVDRNPSWRADKSLKEYTPQEINQMLHLRGTEKAVLDIFGVRLAYYQPQTERLEESLRRFNMGPVHFDYSHIGPGDSGYGFVHNRESKDYKLPEEANPITGAAWCAALSLNDPRKRAALCAP